MNAPKRVWTDLDPSLEASLRRVAQRLQLTRAEAMRRAVEEFVQRHREGEPASTEYTRPRLVNQGMTGESGGARR